MVGPDTGRHNETCLTARPTGGKEGDHGHYCKGTF